MFILKLTAFLCMLVQANAYSRNEGKEYGWLDAFKSRASAYQRDKRSEIVWSWRDAFKGAPLAKEEVDTLDRLSWTVFGYTVSEMQTMFSQKHEKLFKNNEVLRVFKKRFLGDTETTEERLFSLSVYGILAELGAGEISRAEAMARLDGTFGKMSDDTQFAWNYDILGLIADRKSGKIKNE